MAMTDCRCDAADGSDGDGGGSDSVGGGCGGSSGAGW